MGISHVVIFYLIDDWSEVESYGPVSIKSRDNNGTANLTLTKFGKIVELYISSMTYSTTSKDIYFDNVIPAEYRPTYMQRIVGQFNQSSLSSNGMVFFSISGAGINTYSYSAFNSGKAEGTYIL